MFSPVSCLTGTPEAYLAIIVKVACSSAPTGSTPKTPTKYSGAIAIWFSCLPDKRSRSCTSVHFPTLAKMKPRSPRVSHNLLKLSRHCSTENKAQNIKTLKTLSEWSTGGNTTEKPKRNEGLVTHPLYFGRGRGKPRRQNHGKTFVEWSPGAKTIEKL